MCDRRPVAGDFYPVCFKTYEISYATNKDFSQQCDVITEKLKQSLGVIIKMSINDLALPKGHNNDLSWYLSTCYPLLCDRNPKTIQLKSSKQESVDFGGDRGTDSIFDANYMSPPRVTKKRKVAVQAFNRHLPAYQTMMDQVVSEDQHKMVEEAFKDLTMRLMKSNTHRTTNIDRMGQATGLASLCQVDKRSCKKRQAPHGSPTKYKSDC